MRIAVLLVASLALAACNGSINDGTNNGGSDDDSSGGRIDGGSNEFGDGALPQSCKKLDIVFSVDNSSSMAEEKDALANTVFPAFATALLTVGGGLEDYQVGAMDACPNPATFHTKGLGGACNYASAKPWMLSSDPNLADEFKCVGNMDSSDMLCSGNNDDEQPITSATTALESPWIMNQNAGFLRDDALLVVIAITDEDEQPTPNVDAQAVYDRLVAVKGNVKKVVLLGIGGGSNCTGVYGTAEQANKLIAVTNLFKAQQRGVFWDLCQGHLEDGLTEALNTISQACDELPQIP